jgi:hypothetical protein
VGWPAATSVEKAGLKAASLAAGKPSEAGDAALLALAVAAVKGAPSFGKQAWASAMAAEEVATAALAAACARSRGLLPKTKPQRI